MADLLDAALHLEEESIQAGRAEGRRLGQQDGWLEGRSLGIEKGFAVGQELGYYKGSICALLKLSSSTPGLLNDRVRAKLHELMRLIAEYPEDPLNESLQTRMADLRSKFKVVVASLGVLPKYFPKGDAGSLEY